MFRLIVVALLALATYGVLYHNLPCWAQVFDKTMYCQFKAASDAMRAEREADARFRKAHNGKDRFLLELEKRGQKSGR